MSHRMSTRTSPIWPLTTVLLAAGAGASWWWILFLPLGNSHDGRINGRFGLHVRNFLDDGPLGSALGASLDPLAAGAYAHHPPGLNAIQVAIGGLLGRGEWQLHLAGWLAGMATVVLLVVVLRRLGISWPVALVATALTGSTAMFWIYARLGLGMAPGLLLLLLVLRHREAGRQDASWPLRLAVVGAVATSWPNALLAAVLTAWVFRASRRAAVQMGIAGLVTGAAVAAWILQGTDVAELRAHLGDRAVSPVAFGEFVDQYRFFYTSLFPRWYLLLMIPALAAGVARRSTRVPVLIFAGIGVLWTVALPEAAFVHDYWTYPLLGPITIGLGSLLQWATGEGDWRSVVIPAVLAVLAITTFVALQRGPYPTTYFADPAEAGRLLQATQPAPGQTVGYVAGSIALPRWMAYYWDIDATEAYEDTIGSIDPSHLVLVRTDQPPDWAPDSAVLQPAAASGGYALVRAGDLQP